MVAKSLGSANPHNMVKATFAALTALLEPRARWPQRRGKKVADILGRRENEAPPRRRRRTMAKKAAETSAKKTVQVTQIGSADRPQARTSARR